VGLRWPFILAGVDRIRGMIHLAADWSTMIHALPLFQFRRFFKN
jgi:hypothetical protein